jgi:tetratricopeptide (TPR) repeat protein
MRVLPKEPDLPRKTVALALEAAIEVEEPELMAEMLLRHAEKVERTETPLQALRLGGLERAIGLARQEMERDYKAGTLWFLLLSWSCRGEGDKEGAERCLREIVRWWQGKSLERLAGWQGGMAAFLLSRLAESEEATTVALMVLGNNEDRRKVAEAWAEAGRFEEAMEVAEKIRDEWRRSGALREIAEGTAKAGMKERARKVFRWAWKDANEAADFDRLWKVAETAARVGISDLAVEFSKSIAGERAEHLPEVLNALVERQDKGAFLSLLPLCGWAMVTAIRACRCLIRLYPDHAPAIVEKVRQMV